MWSVLEGELQWDVAALACYPTAHRKLRQPEDCQEFNTSLGFTASDKTKANPAVFSLGALEQGAHSSLSVMAGPFGTQ